MAPADLPKEAVGRTLVYLNKDGDRIRSTVTAVGADGHVTWESSDGMTSTTEQPLAGYVAWKGPDDEGTQRFHGDPVFPLEVGKVIRLNYSGDSTKEGAWNGRRLCRVDSEQSVDVRAGTFDTFKVTCKQGSDLSRPSQTRTFYYAPAIGASVLTTISWQDGRSERLELVEYQEPPTSS
ncbi:MAG: hypothetical protein R3349_06410 [Geminicoccaceae bacterium]|nr:hypothetical protein [Geminicoccaceae bacterium]